MNARIQPPSLTAISVTLVLLFSAALLADEGPIGNFHFHRHDRTLALARDGEARYVIVVPDGAPAPVRFAAEELKEHLDRMTGGDFPIVAETPAHGRAIVLGDGPAIRAAGVDPTAIARDGYAVRAVGETILIAGPDDATEKSERVFQAKEPFPRNAGRYRMEYEFGEAAWDFDRGTLYGAYRFLEELGVRWFFPGDQGTVVPSRPDLAFQAFDLTEEPAYILRKVGRTVWQWYMLDSPRLHDLLNREEYEELDYSADKLRLWLLRMRHSSEWVAFNHRPPRLDLEGRFGEEHPEYFALRENGERDLAPQPGRTGHLCYTNPDVLEMTKRDIDAYFSGKTGEDIGLSEHRVALSRHNRGWPESAIYGRTVSLLPHDSFRGCYCPDCLEHTRHDLDRPHWHSSLVWQFIVKAAEWMEEAHPEKLIACLAYATYSERPEWLTELPENVVVGLCPANHARTANNLTDESYGNLMRIVHDWGGVNERPMLIWLHHLYRHRNPRRRGVPMLLTGLYGRMFRDMAPHANLMHIELDSDSIMLEALNRYVMMQLLYNPNLDPAELVADYAASSFGPGGDIALALLRDIEERSNALAAANANNIDTWEEFLTEETVEGYRRQADEMLALTEGTPYAAAADLFSRHFIGEIERGRALYVANVKEVLESREAYVSIRSFEGEIVIDGSLDEEAWQASARLRFRSNITGEFTEYPTDFRLLRAPEYLYFAFKGHDPNARNLSTRQGEADSVEIFLDVEHDHDSYYWIMIDLGNRVLDVYHEGGGEPPDPTWQSGVESAVGFHDDYWVVEVKLPRRSMADGLERPIGRPWGANFCRSMVHPPRDEDRFSSWSPLIRGRFHQPDLFGHIFFVK